MFRRWISGMRFERKRIAALLGFLALYILWVYFLSPTKFSPDTPALVRGLTTFDDRYDPWLIWVHNIYGLYGIPYAVLLLLDDREQTMPGWLFAVASIVVLGIWPLFAWYAFRQPREVSSIKPTWWVRLLESPIAPIYTVGFSIYLTYRAVTIGDFAVLADYAVNDLYIHGCLLDLVLIWIFFPVALRVDMKKRGMTSPWILWGLSALWLVGPIVYLLIRKPLPRPQQLTSA